MPRTYDGRLREGFRPEGPQHHDRIVVEAQPVDGSSPVHAWCYVDSTEQVRDTRRASLISGGCWAPR